MVAEKNCLQSCSINSGKISLHKELAATTSNWGWIENHSTDLYYWVCSTILSTFYFNL